MRRREFITLLGGAAAAWPVVARAQQPTIPVIGFLRNTLQQDSIYLVTALHQGLKEAGYVEGQNLAIEYRWADNRSDRIPALVADLVRSQCAVIIAGGNAPTHAAKAATSTVPIVFVTGEDPVSLGLVASLNRQAGNVTGVTFYGGALVAKQLEVLHEGAAESHRNRHARQPDQHGCRGADQKRAGGGGRSRIETSYSEC